MLSIEQVRELASSYKVIPIVSTLFSGTETPLTIFEKLAASRPGSFLLESAEQGVWSRYSFVGVGSLGSLISESGVLRWIPSHDSVDLNVDFEEISAGGDLAALEQLQKTWVAAPIEDLPPLVAGMVGFLGWDSIQALETLPKPKAKEYEIPELAMSVIRDLVVVDHQESSLKLISNIYLDDEVEVEPLYIEALERITQMKTGLLSKTDPFLAEVDLSSKPAYSRRSTDSQFLDMVEKAKIYVRAGDVFQVVLSQRFEIPVVAESLDVYRMLRALNPSPYMYLLNFADSSGVRLSRLFITCIRACNSLEYLYDSWAPLVSRMSRQRCFMRAHSISLRESSLAALVHRACTSVLGRVGSSCTSVSSMKCVIIRASNPLPLSPAPAAWQVSSSIGTAGMSTSPLPS